MGHPHGPARREHVALAIDLRPVSNVPADQLSVELYGVDRMVLQLALADAVGGNGEGGIRGAGERQQ